MSRFTFFRQSGWGMIASFVGGVFMWAVHPLLIKRVNQVNLGAITAFLERYIHQPLDSSECALFNAFPSIIVIMSIPATGLQTVFAQQAAAAIDDRQDRQLRGTVRTVLAATTLIWLVGLIGVFLFQGRILARLNVSNATALWVTMLVGLPILWQPVLGGLLQGRQNFLWFGIVSMAGGLGRCIAVVGIVRMLQLGGTGAMV